MIELYKTTTTEKPTWNRQEQWPVNADADADRRFDTKVKCPTWRASFWVKFPTVQSLTRVECLGIARGGDGRFWNWLVHKRMWACMFFLQLHFKMDPDEIQIFIKGIEGQTITIDINKVKYMHVPNQRILAKIDLQLFLTESSGVIEYRSVTSQKNKFVKSWDLVPFSS